MTSLVKGQFTAAKIMDWTAILDHNEARLNRETHEPKKAS